MNCRLLCAVALVLGGCGAAFGQAVQGAQDRGWPRVRVASDGTRVIVYQPQIDDWNSYVTLKCRLALEFWPPGAKAGIPGAAQVVADTNTNLATRSVVLYNLRIVSTSFPGTDESTARRLTAALASLGSNWRLATSIDDVLAYFEPGQQLKPTAAPEVRQVADVPEPPAIAYSTTPAVLVLFDGEPVFAPVEGTGLLFAVNTNWSVFQEEGRPETYLLDGNSWLRAPKPTGPWEPAGTLPQGFRAIPKTDNWADVHRNLPGKPVTKERMHRVFVSLRPAELIVIDGEPKAAAIPGTGLAWITNTDSDLFREQASRAYFFLASGRWFRAPALDGPWAWAGTDLPAGFASIPKDHARARVRVSVPGTPEAQEAVLLAQVPHTAEVDRSKVTVNVTYGGEPQFKPISGTTMSYAVNTTYDVILADNRYYTCYQAVWFVSSSPNGPWVVADTVPQVIYTIPPSSPKYNVTYVTVYESTPTTVVVGYTSGYIGVFVAAGVVVYGTSHWYPPYYYYPPGWRYPIWYPPPYTYGFRASYNPYTGTYARSATVYGPYGGVGWGAAYNPRTGTYARGVAAAGPYNAGFAGQAYNPRTGTYGATYQRSTPYAQWGESVVSRGDDWVHTGHYSDARGTIAGAETSKGGKAIGISTDQGRSTFAKTASNDMYATHDGNVYKNTGDGWKTYENGSWQDVQKPPTATPRTSSGGTTAGVTGSSPRATTTGQPTGTRDATATAGATRTAPPSGTRDATGASATGASSGRSAWSQNAAQLQRDQQARSSSAQRQGNVGATAGGGGRRPGGGGGGRRR